MALHGHLDMHGPESVVCDDLTTIRKLDTLTGRFDWFMNMNVN